jgi:hypothetical protein
MLDSRVTEDRVVFISYIGSKKLSKQTLLILRLSLLVLVQVLFLLILTMSSTTAGGRIDAVTTTRLLLLLDDSQCHHQRQQQQEYHQTMIHDDKNVVIDNCDLLRNTETIETANRCLYDWKMYCNMKDFDNDDNESGYDCSCYATPNTNINVKVGTVSTPTTISNRSSICCCSSNNASTIHYFDCITVLINAIQNHLVSHTDYSHGSNMEYIFTDIQQLAFQQVKLLCNIDNQCNQTNFDRKIVHNNVAIVSYSTILNAIDCMILETNTKHIFNKILLQLYTIMLEAIVQPDTDITIFQNNNNIIIEHEQHHHDITATATSTTYNNNQYDPLQIRTIRELLYQLMSVRSQQIKKHVIQTTK